MQIVTLTTDFGIQDFYAGAIKGALLSKNPTMRLVDITHSIVPFDIVQGAFVVKNIWEEFPLGTIHLIGVHCVYDQYFRFIVARQGGHYFLAPDNGILTLLFENLSTADIRVLPTDSSKHFAVKHVFAGAVAQLMEGVDFEQLGEFAGPLLQRISLQPVIMPNRIRGTVIHVDNFDNAIVNIGKDVFEKAANGRSFSLFFKRNDPINGLSSNYCDVPVGESLCLFNSAGFLEIAINLGRAASLLGIKVEDVVEVVFE